MKDESWIISYKDIVISKIDHTIHLCYLPISNSFSVGTGKKGNSYTVQTML